MQHLPLITWGSGSGRGGRAVGGFIACSFTQNCYACYGTTEPPPTAPAPSLRSRRPTLSTALSLARLLAPPRIACARLSARFSFELVRRGSLAAPLVQQSQRLSVEVHLPPPPALPLLQSALPLPTASSNPCLLPALQPCPTLINRVKVVPLSHSLLSPPSHPTLPSACPFLLLFFK